MQHVIVPRYYPVEVEVGLERQALNSIDLPMSGTMRAGDHQYRLDVFNKGRRRVMHRDLGRTIPERYQLAHDDVVTLLEQQELSDDRSWFVLEYELVSRRGGGRDSVVSRGPLKIDTGGALLPVGTATSSGTGS